MVELWNGGNNYQSALRLTLRPTLRPLVPLQATHGEPFGFIVISITPE